MDKAREIDISTIMYAVKLVQPGRISDIVEGLNRLLPDLATVDDVKKQTERQLRRLIDLELLSIYAHTRYILSEKGEQYISETGLRHPLEARRLFLLKETRRGMT